MKTQFDYMFRYAPEALDELNQLGITFEEVDYHDSGDMFPALKLPSGLLLVIMENDDCTGYGHLEIYFDDL